MRKLVTVRTIDEINPIKNADAIECVTIGGWELVAKKGEFSVGESAVYFELDSFLPENDHRFQFLMKNKIFWEGKHGARLKSIKLRGQVSQGLALPLEAFPEISQEYNGIPQDQDFSELLNVFKWDRPIPAQLSGKMKGNFPSFLKKTDQERVQNLAKEVFSDPDAYFEVSVKLEGSSMTVYKHEGVFGVCSRNIDLKIDQEGNSFVDTAKKYDLENIVPEGYAFSGELMGPGIQGNIEGFDTLKYFIYDIFDIKKGKKLSYDEREDFVYLHLKDRKLDYVPILGYGTLEDLGIDSMQKLIEYADGPSINAKLREGLVFRLKDSEFSFKVISNKYLLKMG